MEFRHAIAGLVLLGAAACTNPTPPDDRCAPSPSEEMPEDDVRLAGADPHMCKEAIPGHNRTDQKRINIVFVGTNISPENYVRRTADAVDCQGTEDGILSVEPYASNPRAFNFWYVPTTLTVPMPTQEWYTDVSALRSPSVAHADGCDLPNKAVVILTEMDFRPYGEFSSLIDLNLHEMDLAGIGDAQRLFTYIPYDDCRRIVDTCASAPFAYPASCTAIRELRGRQDPTSDRDICALLGDGGDIGFGVAYLARASSPTMVAHEIGHSLLGLHDEYLDLTHERVSNPEDLADFIRRRGINCYAAHGLKECERDAPWAGLAHCYQGCDYVDELGDTPVWRSVDEGLMSDSTSIDLGIWDEMRACDVLHAVTQDAHGYCGTIGRSSDERE